jgi:hypothetical protein
MNLPKIDIASLPDLDTLTGVFGSISNLGRADVFSDDTIIVLMVFVYEVWPDGLPGL